MKKILFVAVLVAGTTLGFAKENVETSKKEAVTEVKKEAVTEANEENKKDDVVRKICVTMYSWTTYESHTDFRTGQIVYMTYHHIAQTTHWCGENDTRTTWVDGRP